MLDYKRLPGSTEIQRPRQSYLEHAAIADRVCHNKNLCGTLRSELELRAVCELHARQGVTQAR